MAPKPKRILLVDDNPNDLELALAAFQESDTPHDVRTATGGLAALELLRAAPAEERPHVVLLDLNMTHMDGLSVLDAIRSDPGLHDIPVVMLSTSRAQGDIQACYARGASAYVVKPMDFSRFTDAVKAIGGFWVDLNEAPPRLH
ncbi:response regulator [Deinococcus maricopensis]|uniref:Response regulator receiver protein n=1 Tax=Deinococcus maricopensis (strain DSM 21211 / LMG 22137 / NRRL B-23946 / LB-34) TaxID=709986 RepID=E8U7D1_DEIML|nr:response regulator [Deinococcus maricopensis]ADV66970.1 response regulator receiver protein [Deinococcus maricopensis DSM 21211]